MLSRTYALKIVQHMARRQNRRFSSKELSEALHIPAMYAAKVCQSLAHCGILKGFRGPGGGYQILSLSVPLLAFLGHMHCPLGLDLCFKEGPFRTECNLIKAKAMKVSLIDMPDVRNAKPPSDRERLERLSRYHGLSSALWR